MISARKALTEFCVLFNEQKFFEAHEVLELLWREEKKLKSDKTDFYQGLIQIAAAFVHYQKGNKESAIRLLDSASKYLKSFKVPFEGVDHARLLTKSRECANKNSAIPSIDLLD